MRIKRIEIDGFKSYAQRQLVDNYDAQFNAITGLNGSGKSNILDSICFVLGITDLKCIRAENMNALVYKSGQAGINKATVTIVFDNTDKQNSPLGYNQCDEITVRRQVIVNGRNSYTINGSSQTNSKVSDFFRGVGLNVNNPHFLIMQGRITKVLNMKPHEILGMVEEAAGTKMYEQKRQQALNMIQKKQCKVDEINKLMNDEIIPQVEKLKQDRANYHEYTKCKRDKETAQRKLSAFVYAASLNSAEQMDTESADLRIKIVECEDIVTNSKDKERSLESELHKMEQTKRDKNDAGRNDAENDLRVAKEEFLAVEGEYTELVEDVANMRNEIVKKTKSIEDDRKELKKKNEELVKKQSEIGGEEERARKAEEALRVNRERLEQLSKGLLTDELGQTISLEGQIASTRKELTALQTDMTKADMKKKRIVPDLKKKTKDFENMRLQTSTESGELVMLEDDARKYETELKKLTFNEKADATMRQRLPDINMRLIELERERKLIQAAYVPVELELQNLPSTFDREKEICGVVCNLFRVKDPKYYLAVDTLCSASLHHIVVHRQQTARMLVDGRHLKDRRTFIPLDNLKFTPQSQYEPRFRTAQSIAQTFGDQCKRVLDLIEFDPIYTPAMEYIFQGSIVCEIPEAASEICFHKGCKLKTVTVRGDIFYPMGMVSGGAIEKNKKCILQIVAPYPAIKSEMVDLSREQEQIENELRRTDPIRQRYLKIKEDYQRITGRLQVINDNLKNSPVQLLKEEISVLQKELEECEAQLSSGKSRIDELLAKINEYEKQKKNEKEFRESKEKEFRTNIKAAEATLKQMKGSSAKATLDTIRALIADIEEQIVTQQNEMTMFEEKIKSSETEIAEKNKALQNSQRKVDVTQAALDAFLSELQRCDDDIKKVQKGLDTIRKESRKAETAIEGHRRTLEKKEHDAGVMRKTAQTELKKNPWIEDEKNHFGQKGTDYDFHGYNEDKGAALVKSIEARMKELEKKLNTKAMQVLGVAEEQVLNLQKKKDQIEIDRQKLLETIALLDEKKRNEIRKAHEQVNRDFGNIFSTLLPSTAAKLEPPEGKSVFEGLEVKVAFNGKWKDSLNELSGGQRSLVALSLVLAMLKFKPAPIYILDEVDSALDLSHTQNIGHMIKKHFTNSQFIIVSLKEGMFNHANVLYRTKFVDGTSQVTRTENRS